VQLSVSKQYSKNSVMFPVAGFAMVLVNLKKCPSTCGVVLVKCQLVCVYTTCFRFVLKDHLGPLLDFGLPVHTSVGLFVPFCL